MEYFLAVSDKQLGLCLRLLYAEGIRAIVETVRNSKGKIEFHIKANTDEALLRDLIERYTQFQQSKRSEQGLLLFRFSWYYILQRRR